MISRHLIQLFLQSAPAVTAIVGKRIGSRKVPQWTDADKGPYVTIQQRAAHHEMSTKGPIGTQWSDQRIVAHALTPKAADSVLDAIRTFLKQEAQAIASAGPIQVTAGTVTISIKGIFEEDDEAEDWLPSPHMDESGLHIAECTFRIWSTEES